MRVRRPAGIRETGFTATLWSRGSTLHRRRWTATWVPMTEEAPLVQTRYEGVIRVRAIFEATTRSAALGWRVRQGAGWRPPEVRVSRRGGSRLLAELRALRGGLAQARQLGCRSVLVETTDRRLVGALSGRIRRLARRTTRGVQQVRSELSGLSAWTVAVVPANRRSALAKQVREALDLGLREAEEDRVRRIALLSRTIFRALSVGLEERNGDVIASGRYRVSLDPVGCECPAWRSRWASVSLAGRRARRLPCKHLVALARREGIVLADELLALARKAPE